MADQQNFARMVIALSSVVVAACAVVVTVKVMSTDGISVKQPRVLDQAALERQVAVSAGSSGEEPADVECPISVVVEVGNKFDCRVREGTDTTNLVVKVISDQGDISVETLG